MELILSNAQSKIGNNVEEWRDVPGFGGNYQASTYGRIRSKPRIVRKRHKSGKVIRQRYGVRVLECPTSHGYAVAHISVEGRKQNVRVHHMVLLAFKGPRPDGALGLHRDGNSFNNCPENLRWGSHADNMEDRKRHGNYATGERHPMSKLTDQQVEEIRSRALTCREVVNEYGISRSQAYRILRGCSR